MGFRPVLFLLLPLCALAAPKRSGEIDRTFAALEQAWSAAYLKHDLPAIERLLAEEFVGIDGRGVTSVRADELAEARPRAADAPPPSMEILSEEISDVQARVYGDTAVVTALNTATIRTQDGQSVVRYRRSTVWVRRAGRWQCVHFHASRVV
ncbi:MAG TPA: nuclear transport factor 2 family protein [Myxococcaceae bacterium]|nr:nuclear transport factor 2 family protein [Myxococcaceae bacterium]